MRPIEIKISAFGPFAEPVTLDMTRLGKEGIFLVAGDTGAGKTTLFDAITYTLYGTPSGSERKKYMMRSRYADPGTLTEVLMTFEHAGRLYTVKRVPEQMRLKKKGAENKEEGKITEADLTKQNAEASLICHNPDGIDEVTTGENEVTKKVTELLRLDSSQFKKIAMLAQGEFREFLFANTKQKGEIFRKIFHTGIYENLTKKLKEDKKLVDSTYNQLTASVKQNVGEVEYDDVDPVRLQVENTLNNVITYTEFLPFLEAQIEKDEAEAEKVKDTLAYQEKELLEISGKLAEAKQLAIARDNLKNTSQELAKLEPQNKQLETALDSAKKGLAQKENLHEQYVQLDEELRNHAAIATLQTDLETLQKSAEKMKKTIDENKVKVEENTKAIEQKKKELATLQDAGAQQEKCIAEYNELKKIQPTWNAIANNKARYEDERQRLESVQKTCIALENEWKVARLSLDERETAFRMGLAGILAEQLEENTPCPVCGSTHHPQRAYKQSNVPTEEQLDALQKEVEEKRKKSQNKSIESAQKNAEVQNLKQKWREAAEAFGLDIDVEAEEYENAYQTCRTEIHARNKAVSTQLQKIKEDIARKDNLEKVIPQLEATQKKLEEMQADLQAKSFGNKSAQEEKNTQLKALKAKLSFATAKDARDKKSELEQQMKNLQTAYDAASDNHQKYLTQVESLKGQKKGFEETIKKIPAVDVAAENAKKEQLDENHEKMNQRNLRLRDKLTINRSCYQKIDADVQKLKDAEEKHKWLSRLTEILAGEVSQEQKLSLETYIQGNYLDRILVKANQRFYEMSGGQYELTRLQEGTAMNKQTGLELGVKDYYCGDVRAVQSLSGGESFMASLCLALGLSDEIQELSGGVILDTLFVDEGFGSLDSGTLEVAYKTLSKLATGNKLIGIISHVESMHEKVEKQIKVTKDKVKGSSAVIIA